MYGQTDFSSDSFFFSKSLIRKLAHLSEGPLSVFEAPAGYGKTTAAHRALDGLGDAVRWYTAVESMPDNSFRWFIQQIGFIDEQASRRLSDLGYLNRSNADQAAAIIAEIRAEEAVTLVFDNFQFAAESWQPQIFDSLAKRGKGLNTVFISQNFGRLRGVLSALEDSICYIRGRDMLLSEDDVRAFARQLGTDVSASDVHSIYRRTDGWAAAVALFLRGYRDSDLSGRAPDVNELLESIFWNRLSDPQREALLRICLFDRISAQTLQRLLPGSLLTEEDVSTLLRRTPLMRYNEAKRDYYPHEILTGFLKTNLEASESAFRNEVYRRAGEEYRLKDMTREAVNCFYKARDWEGILSCRLVCLITERFDGVSYTQVAKSVLSKCPDDIQVKYPLSLLRLCYAVYAGCEFDEFDRQMERIKKMEVFSDPSLLGEWYLVDALSDFPDLDRMEAKYKEAEKLLKDASQIFIKEEPFMFGCTSMWYLFYSKPGTMMETADRFAEVMKLYNRLTNGHGAGAAEIYRGEALSVQGLFEESDIQAYQAAFLSEQYSNVTATYGAALLLGINAIYSSNMVGLQKAVDYLENKALGYSYMQGRSLNTYMVETVRGYLLSLMMETGRSALWTQGSADSLSDLTFTNFMIKTCRITDLLLKKEYKQAIASVEASLRLDPRLISTSTRNFMYCGLTLGYMAIGRFIKASEYLDKSLEIAGQDKNYTFLACFRKYFQVLFIMPQIASKHAQTINEIKAVDIRYTRADESHIFAMLEEVPELKEALTPREREVAELAAKGLHNSEIAAALTISEHTVKQHLKNAFQKMNIDRRSRLIEMLR